MSTCLPINADEIAARRELEPRPVAFSRPTLPLGDALVELTKQTGNRVVDLRTNKTNPMVTLPTQALTFWPALDSIGAQTQIGFSAFREKGAVVLVDAPYRPMPTTYSGLLRIALRRTNLARDDEAQSHTCTLILDVAWEPRFQPFLLDLKKAALTYAPDAKKETQREMVAGQGAISVTGQSATEVDVRAQAPARSSPGIGVVEGTLSVIGPSKMLDFTFKDLTPLAAKPAAPLHAEQEGVAVRVNSGKFNGDVVLVALTIENPPGGPAFESFQSWLDNNAVELTDGKRVLRPESSEGGMESARKAHVSYHFRAGKGVVPRSLQGWTLRYQTPGRIVELREAFRLEDLKLP